MDIPSYSRSQLGRKIILQGKIIDRAHEASPQFMKLLYIHTDPSNVKYTVLLQGKSHQYHDNLHRYMLTF